MGVLKRLMDILRSFYKRRILFYTTVGGVIAIVIVLLLIPPKREEVKPEGPVRQVVKDLVVFVPEGAFSKPRSFEINRLSDSEVAQLESRIAGLKVVANEAYRVKPSDGIDEFAFKPVTIRIYIPSEYFYGDDFTGVALAYVPEDNPSVYYIYPGSYLGKNEKGYYVEAKAFHVASFIMAVQVPAEKQIHSLRLVREVVSSIKPAVIIVPGEDPKFSGGLTELNYWTSVFPDRTIYIYDYPLSKPRSKSYMDSAEEFFNERGIRSYVLFEAENLASLLKDPLFSKQDYVVIAHGVGGLIARLALELHPEIKNVKKLVLVCTPSAGTNLANPLYFSSFIYGKADDVVSENLAVPKDMVPLLREHIFNYLEKVNVFYSDLIPKSRVFSMLKPRSDIQYLVIAGTRPPMRINLKGSVLEKIYPELVLDRGDGVVSVDSAKIPGKPMLKFDIYFTMTSRQDVLSAIKAFVDTERLPKVSEFKSDIFPEYATKEPVLKEETPPSTPQRVLEKPKEIEEFRQPSGYVMKDILRILARREVVGYRGGGCVKDRPYFITVNGLESWNGILERGDFSFLKDIGDELTMICSSRTCKVNPIGFSRGQSEISTDGAEDVYVSRDGKVFLTSGGEGGSVQLLLSTPNGMKLVYEAPGITGKIIPRKEGMIFLTNEAAVMLREDGTVEKYIPMSSIAPEGFRAEAVYAYEDEGMLYVLTEDHYLLVYDEKTKKSWMVGEGLIAEGFKIVKYNDRYLLIVGRRNVFFVDTELKKIKGCYQRFPFEIIDAVACDGKVYLVVKRGEMEEIRVYKPVGLDLPCGYWR